MSTGVQIRRVYEPAHADDGYRVFVDRLWPRGIAKADFTFDLWCKDLAPSPALRKWFGHKAENWEQFVDSYQRELRTPEQKERIQALLKKARGRRITLVYGAKDPEHNHAVVLAREIQGG